MSFLSPWLLLGLLLIPAAVAWYVWDERRRLRGREAFASAALMPAVAPRGRGPLRHLAPLLYLLAFAVLLVAVARPQATATVKVERAAVMLVTDRSGSMLADDVAGGRMEAAKGAASRFLQAVPEDVRVGLIGFSHEVELLQTPTTERARVEDELRALDPGGSTAAGEALARALRVLRPEGDTGTPPPGAIILLSDGESVRGRDPVAVARLAAQEDVKIHTVALGTDDGVLRTARPDGSVREQAVPPDRETLRQIAEVSGGEAFDAPDAASLARVYEQLGSQVAEREETREITAPLAGGALLLLALGAGAALLLTGRLP